MYGSKLKKGKGEKGDAGVLNSFKSSQNSHLALGEMSKLYEEEKINP